MFVDTHCHIFSEYYQNIDLYIKNAKENNVFYYINNGTDDKSNKEVLDLISKYPNMYGAIGIHPEAVNSYEKKEIDFIEENLSNKKIVAIGEIGLDYHYTKDDKDKQIELFECQLSLAEKYNIPVIIHSRDATEDTINILKKFNVRGVIHSFSGSFETAEIYLKMGFKLGINGVITFKNAKLKDTIKRLSLSDLVLETDSPYLTPEPFRGRQNESKNIYEIAKFLSELFETDLEKVAEITNKNVLSIFDKIDNSMI